MHLSQVADFDSQWAMPTKSSYEIPFAQDEADDAWRRRTG